jgi:NTE family protein
MDSVNDPVKQRVRDRKEVAVAKLAKVPRHQGLKLEGKRIVLLLQGGGALGAYHVGAFEALANECRKAENNIDWVAGISIGAINSAVIAAPKSGDAVRELELLWDELLWPEYPPFDYTGLMRAWLPWPWLSVIEPKYMDWTWMAFNPWGHANFFSSRVLNLFRNPWVQQWFRKLDRHELAFYGTRRLKNTLDRHVNWEALNERKNTRLSLGATHVCDGEVEFFDSRDMLLNANHVRASGALPPAFPPIQIGKEWYFDGGVSNNTPIEVLAKLLFKSKKNTLVFLVDLWDRKNDVLPESFEDVLWRLKSIQYGSRKKAAEIVVERYEHRAEKKGQLKDQIPRLEVCQVMLEHPDDEPQFSFADADFSRSTFRDLRSQGFKDMIEAIHYPERVTHDQQGHLLRHHYATLYRHGSEGKWKVPRVQHQHRGSNHRDLPSALKLWKSWCEQFA